MVVYPERMNANLESRGGLYNSQRVLLALTQKGMIREDAYATVQRSAMGAWEKGRDFAALLKADKNVAAHLDGKEVDALFDLGYHLKHVDTIFSRVFGKT